MKKSVRLAYWGLLIFIVDSILLFSVGFVAELVNFLYRNIFLDTFIIFLFLISFFSLATHILGVYQIGKYFNSKIIKFNAVCFFVLLLLIVYLPPFIFKLILLFGYNNKLLDYMISLSIMITKLNLLFLPNLYLFLFLLVLLYSSPFYFISNYLKGIYEISKENYFDIAYYRFRSLFLSTLIFSLIISIFSFLGYYLGGTKDQEIDFNIFYLISIIGINVFTIYLIIIAIYSLGITLIGFSKLEKALENKIKN